MSIIQDPDNVYFSIDIFNNTGASIPAQYSTSQNTPILNNRDRYKILVTKFNIPSNAVPLFIYNPTLYPAIVALSYNGNIYQQTVQLTNLNTSATPPIPQTIINNAPIYYQQVGLGNNIIYYYWQFLQAINYAFELCMADLQFHNMSVTANPPYFIFNEQTQLFSLIAEVGYDPSNDSPNGVGIYSNAFVYLLFSGIPAYYDTTNLTNVRNNNYMIYNKAGTNTITTQFSTSGYEMTSQVSSVSYWFSARKLLITSNTMSISALNLNNPNVGSQNQNKNLNAILEFDVNFNTSIGQLSPWSYVPLGQNKYVDFYVKDALSTIDFNIFWIDNYYNQYPLYITPNTSMNLEILIKKTSYNV